MNNQEPYDYDFDAPTYVNFDDYPQTDFEWSDFVDESDEEDKENEPINETANSNGIQRQSLYKRNNMEHMNMNNVIQMNSNDIVYEKPVTTMKNQKEVVLLHMQNLNEVQENDENEINNENDEDKIMKLNEQIRPEIVENRENNANLKQTMTVNKPKQTQPTNRAHKTAQNMKNVSRPPQILPKKELTRPIGPRFATKKPNKNNNAATSTGGRPALHQASTATVAVANTVAREGGKAKMASRPAGVCGAIGGGTARKQVNTVPVAPNLATSQRANMKKEKLEAKQSATTATTVMTLDRQIGQSRPPVSARTPFPKCATVGRVVDKKPVNQVLDRMRTEEHKEKPQDKPTGRVPQPPSARTVGLPRSAITNSKSAPKHQPVAWNY